VAWFGRTTAKVTEQPDRVLSRVAEQALTKTRATGAAVALPTADGMVCWARAGITAPTFGSRFDPSSGICGESLQRGVALRCDDSLSDLRVNREVCEDWGVRSVAAVPIHGPEKIMGILAVFSTKTRAFNDKAIAALEQTAELIAASMRRAAS
jgi:GAF domain-containing protein